MKLSIKKWKTLLKNAQNKNLDNHYSRNNNNNKEFKYISANSSLLLLITLVKKPYKLFF